MSLRQAIGIVAHDSLDRAPLYNALRSFQSQGRGPQVSVLIVWLEPTKQIRASNVTPEPLDCRDSATAVDGIL